MPRDGSSIYHYPAGIEGVPNQTIESAGYNSFLSDVEQDLNVPRPILAGGTGANNVTNALANLSAERARQIITNFDADIIVPGSFYAATTATGSPAPGHAFAGICYAADTTNIVVEARDLNDVAHPIYSRVMVAGVWEAWTNPTAALPNYLGGLDMAYISPTTISVASGAATDSAWSVLIARVAAMSKTTAVWAAGSGVGGLDSGTIAASTWYYWYLIWGPAVLPEVIFSINQPLPSFPSGYTKARYIGARKTNASSQWLPFVQDGDRVMLHTPILDVTHDNPGLSAVLRTLSTPPGKKVRAIMQVSISAINAKDFPTGILISDPDGADVAPSHSAQSLMFYLTTAGAGDLGGTVECMTNTASQVRSRWQTSSTPGTFYIATAGWVDRRI